MSIKVMTHVWEHSKQKGAGLLLMLAIADNSNDDGDCFPGIARLAQRVRTDDRNVKRMIVKLEESGELLVFPEAGIRTDHGWTNLYRIVMSEEQAKAPLKTGRYASERGGKFITPRRVGVVKTPPQGVVTLPPDPSVDPSDQKEVVVARDVFFHSVFLEVTNTPSRSQIPTTPQREPDDTDFLIELFADYFGDRFAPTRQTVLASVVRYTFVEVRHALEEAKVTNKSGVVQWAYVESILERRYQQHLDRVSTFTPHDQLLGLRRGYQPETPEDSMIYTHPLWLAFRDRWQAKTTVAPNIPPLSVKRYADTARALERMRVTTEQIGRLVDRVLAKKRTEYKFEFAVGDINAILTEDAMQRQQRDPALVEAACKVWKASAGDFVNGILDILSSLDIPITPEEIYQFGAWYAAQPQFKSQLKPPSSADALLKRVHEYRAQRPATTSTTTTTPNHYRPSQRRPLTPEEIEQRRQMSADAKARAEGIATP